MKSKSLTIVGTFLVLVLSGLAQAQTQVQYKSVQSIASAQVKWTWVTTTGNTLYVHVKGNFSENFLPAVTDSDTTLTMIEEHMSSGLLQLTYADYSPITGNNTISVLFGEFGTTITYDIVAEELGTVPVVTACCDDGLN